jgi:hypothetical protein
MITQEKVNEFAADVAKERDDNNLQDGDYCIIVYSTSNMTNCKTVKFIYKGIETFKLDAVKDTKDIDEMYAIDVQMWIFD